MECYTETESSELVIYAATWMNLLRIMLGAKKKKKSQSEQYSFLGGGLTARLVGS